KQSHELVHGVGGRRADGVSVFAQERAPIDACRPPREVPALEIDQQRPFDLRRLSDRCERDAAAFTLAAKPCAEIFSGERHRFSRRYIGCQYCAIGAFHTLRQKRRVKTIDPFTNAMGHEDTKTRNKTNVIVFRTFVLSWLIRLM